MKYYKEGSNPLKQIELNTGECGYDIYGNYIEIGITGDPFIVIKSVLNEGEKINVFENEKQFLKAFWTLSKKNKNEVQHSNRRKTR